MFKSPALLAYPDISHIDECAEIKGLYCYIIEPYTPGIAVVIRLQGSDAGIVVGDWEGKHTSPKDDAIWKQSQDFLEHSAYAFIQMMRHIKIDQAEYFISKEGLLVDVQLSLNKFIGPGMLRDIFSDISKPQGVKEIAVMDGDKIKELRDSGQSYILKPSRYRHHMRDDCILPLYARI